MKAFISSYRNKSLNLNLKGFLHYGLAPMEIYTGSVTDMSFSEKIIIARRNKIVENKDRSSGLC